KISGKLLDASDEPLADRVVQALTRVPETNRWVPVARALTNKAGGFLFDSLGAGSRLVHDDGLSQPAFADAHPGAGSLALRVPLEAVLALRVLDAADKPLNGAVVEVRQFSSERPDLLIRRHATPADDGTVLVKGLSTVLDRTIVDIVASDGSFERRTVTSPLSVREELGTMRVLPVANVKGTVRGPSGDPVSGALVTEIGARRPLGTTDARGEVTLRLPVGLEQAARVSADGFLPATVALSSELPLRVVLKKAARVSVRLRRQDGTIPASARLVVVTHDLIEGKSVSARPEQEDLFAFDVAPGDAVFRVDGEGAESLSLGPLHLSSGEVAELGIVTLSSGAVVSGRVLDEATLQPLAGAVVTIQSASENDLYDLLREHLPRATTDATGTFRVAGLKEGEVRIFVEGSGRPVVRVDARAFPEGADVGDIQLGEGQPLALHVQREDGSPLSSTRIGVRPGGFDGTLKEMLFQTDESGDVRIPRIAPGRYGLVADASSRQHRLAVTVSKADAALRWTILAATVRGRVLGGDGRPLEGIRVELATPHDGRIRLLDVARRSQDGVPLGRHQRGDLPAGGETITDTEGAFVFPDVPEGPMRLLPSQGATAGIWHAIAVPSKGELVRDLPFAGDALSVTLVRHEDDRAWEGSARLTGLGGQELSRVECTGTAKFLLPPGSSPRCVAASDRDGRKGLTCLEGNSREVLVRVGAPMGQLSVSLRDSTGDAAAAARIALVRLDDGLTVAGSTDVNGGFRRGPLAAGRYRILARGAGGETARLVADVPPGRLDLPVVLRRSGSLSLVFETGEKFDSRTSSVSVVDRDGDDRAREEEAYGRPARLDEKGRYSLPALEAGTYSVRARPGSPTTPDIEFRVEVREGRVTEKRVKPN
ncbi:MAG: carboxypeptidase regulatory-like domain-containing protein, partial [Acidobacteria bacterium]|nr:carboxypeptidase regulatory-like domain-containing protein [Acidobacteriota bacterium]